MDMISYFIEQIKNDYNYLGLMLNLSEIKHINKNDYKSKIKKQIKKVAFSEYVKEKNNMKKLSKLHYTKHKNKIILFQMNTPINKNKLFLV